MTVVHELKKTRKLLLSISQLALILIVAVLVGQWYMFNKVGEKEQRINQSQTALRQAETQLDNYKLDDQSSLFQLEKLRELSPLPHTKKFIQSFKLLDSAQIYINGLIQSEKAWKEISIKSEQAYTHLNSQCNNIVATNKNNTEFALSILEAAQTIKHLIQSPPALPAQRESEISMLDFQIKKADSLVHADESNPQTMKVRKSWSDWMTITQEQLLEEKSFFEQKKSATTKLTGYAMVLQNEAAKQQSMKKTYNIMYSVMLLSLALLALLTQRAIYKNPHLNTMLSPRGKATIMSEISEMDTQVRRLKKLTVETITGNKQELERLNDIIQDSDAVDSEIRSLKTLAGNFISVQAHALQSMESNLRTENLKVQADKISTVLGQVQTEGANLAQALENLGESNVSLQHELKSIGQVVKNIGDKMDRLQEINDALHSIHSTLNSATE